jgi:hypothetical protein
MDRRHHAESTGRSALIIDHAAFTYCFSTNRVDLQQKKTRHSD